MRILVLCHEFPPIGGGAGVVCAALCEEYVRQGADVTVLTMAFPGLAREESLEGVRVIRLESGRRRREMASPVEALRWAVRAQRKAWKIQSSTPFDVSHAHFIIPGGMVARHLRCRAGAPFVVTLHGSDVPGYNRERLRLAHILARPWWRSILRSADRIVSPSRSLLGLLQRVEKGCESEVIPNGFEPGRFHGDGKGKYILLCSRLVERKGFQYFLAAVMGLDLPGWQVDIVGDGPMYQRLAEQAARCRVPVMMHGWMDNADPAMARLFARAGIFVFPSEWENFSVALLEGMSAGCAVITTDSGGNPEVVGDCGVLVPPGDVGALRVALQRLTREPELRNRLGARAAARAAREFSWELVAGRYLQLLSRVAGSAGGIR